MKLFFTGISTDGAQRIVITVGDKPATGDGLNTKDYAISLFEEDNPDTTEDESEGNDNGFLTYSHKINNNWLTGADAEHGNITVTECNSSAHEISGTFDITYYSSPGNISMQFTEGRFNKINYKVLN